MKNIIVLVSGGGTNLQALIDAEKRGKIENGRITCVISSKEGAFALTRAARNGIKGVTLPRKDYPDNKAYSEALLEILRQENADVIVYAGFMTILDECVCKAYPYKMINVHPALIPSFCGKGYYGLKVHEEVLKKGVKVTGATVHFVTEECDGGPIILQQAVRVHSGDTPERLQKRVMEQAEWIILPRAVSLLCADKIEIRDGRAYPQPLPKEQELIDKLTAEKLKYIHLEADPPHEQDNIPNPFGVLTREELTFFEKNSFIAEILSEKWEELKYKNE